MSLVVVVSFQPVKDELISVTSHFDGIVNPFEFAPDSVLQSLSLYPNTFSTCTFNDRIHYFDQDGIKYFLKGNVREIIPFTTNSIVTTQTNRDIKDFQVDVIASCPVTQTGGVFSSLKSVLDGGNVQLDIYYAKPDGTMSKIYSKSNPLTAKPGTSLSSDQTLFTIKIPASELENKMIHPSNSYQSNIRIVPNSQISIHYSGVAGVDSTKWTVVGKSETNLKVNVIDEKYQCLFSCILNNKQINTSQIPTDGKVSIKSPRVTFTITLPQWTSDQGSPSFRIVNAETGVNITTLTPFVLSKSGTDGVATKSLLLPSTVGRYDVIVTQQGRDTAVMSFDVYQPSTLPPEKPKIPGEECEENYVLIDGVCFLENSPPNNNPKVSDTKKGLEEWFSCVNEGMESPCHEKYYGYYGGLIFLFFIIVVLKYLFSKKG